MRVEPLWVGDPIEVTEPEAYGAKRDSPGLQQAFNPQRVAGGFLRRGKSLTLARTLVHFR